MDVSAAVAHKPHEDFSIEPLALDQPREDEVVVEIRGSGICHTDLAARDGAIPIELPAVFGHEGSGVVRSVGGGVSNVKQGDRVTLTFNSCGDCPSCSESQPAYCHMFAALNYAGSRLDGTGALAGSDGGKVGNYFFAQSSFATHAIARARNVVKVDDDLDLELLGPLGCGIQTGAGAVMNSLACPSGSSLLVLGGGAVGLSAVMAGAVQGCEHIILSEPHASRRDLARELGATHVIDPAATDLAEEVRGIVPAGAEFAFDTTGIPGVMEATVQALAPRGRLGMVGVPTDPSAVLSLNLIQSMLVGLRLSAIVEGDSNPDEFIPRLIGLHREGRFPFDKLITKYPFTEINKAIRDTEHGDVVKAVLVPEA